VNTNIRSPQAFTKIQDEQAYTMMVEDFAKFIMRTKTISLIKVVPQMMHGGFISAKVCEAVTNKFQGLTENSEGKFTEEECAMISVCCV
jgi:hypothetical protein